jgi:hypothetical protein
MNKNVDFSQIKGAIWSVKCIVFSVVLRLDQDRAGHLPGTTLGI